MTQVDEKLAKKVFFDVADMLESIEVQFFLSQATCLGAYREGGIIGGSQEDVDLITKSEEFIPKFPLLKEALAGKGYHFGASTVPFNQINQIAVIVNDVRVDINSLFLIDDYRWQPGKNIDFFYSAYLFENPEQIEFLGREFNVPTPVTEYLEWQFGSDYMTPKDPFMIWDVPKERIGHFDRNKVPEELR